jgi:YD repeat-containing protein
MKVIAPDLASATTYSYVANTVTVTDPAGKWKTFTMDAFGNLTTVVEPDASQTNASNQATTTYTYDALNHLIGVSMPRQMPGGNVVTQTSTFNYLVGNTITAYLQSATNPENGTVSYSYNSDGTMATKLDAKGQALTYAYDGYGRVLTVSLAGVLTPCCEPRVTAILELSFPSNQPLTQNDPSKRLRSHCILTLEADRLAAHSSRWLRSCKILMNPIWFGAKRAPENKKIQNEPTGVPCSTAQAL